MSGVVGLAGEKYIGLTTFQQDGTPVATPVWVVSDDGRRGCSCGRGRRRGR
jgi:hypothetical protein